MPLEEKTQEELIEQIRRMQDRLNARQSGESAAVEAIAKRCQDYRKAARLANARADKAEARLKIMSAAYTKAFSEISESVDD